MSVYWHMDHVAGLPLLIYQLGLLERTRPLWIYGPPGTASNVGQILAIGIIPPDWLSYECHTVDATREMRYDLSPVSIHFYHTTHLDRLKCGSLRDPGDPSWVTAYGMVIHVGKVNLPCTT